MVRTLIGCVVFALVACGGSRQTHGDDVGDGPNECSPDGAHRCSGSTYQVCTGALWTTETDCLTGCVDTLGCVACTPGENFCKDGDVWSCDDNGQAGMLVEACTGANTCDGGGCTDACASASTNKSYIGCEYWAVDLDNAVEVWGAIGEDLGQGRTLTSTVCTQGQGGTIVTYDVCFATQGNKIFTRGACDPPSAPGGQRSCPAGFACGPQSACVSDAQHSPFSIVVSNPSTKMATVTLTAPGGETIVKTVAGGQLVTFAPQAGGIPDQSVDGTIQTKNAYKLVSDLPIVAYQFNPLDNVKVFSNDASLLIPRTAFDTDYYAMSWQTYDRRAFTGGSNPYYGYLTVVAWQDGTQIAVTPPTAVRASATQQTIAAGTTAMFTLNAFEVLQLEAAPAVAPAGDLTGTHITSPNSMTFGVFGGHEAAPFGETTPPDATHTQGPGYADHLEEMMFPSRTWGKTFAIARSQPRTNEPDLLRVMAQKAGTTVTFTPAPASGTCGTLGPGEHCDVKILGDTEVTGSEPILVGHFLESATWWNAGQTSFVGTGDPSMALAGPTEQYRTDYTILVPSQYAMNYVSIAAAATGGVTVDNTAVTVTPFPGGGTHRGARVPLAAGAHAIHCADGCGITVYGYSDGVSYMFAGGLNLKAIVIF